MYLLDIVCFFYVFFIFVCFLHVYGKNVFFSIFLSVFRIIHLICLSLAYFFLQVVFMKHLD